MAELQAEFCAEISSGPPFAVGVSVGLAPAEPRTGSLALATPDKVFRLPLRESPSPMQRRALQELFSDIQYLAGFESPYTIVMLAHTLGSIVSGYDLSTLALPSKQRYNDAEKFLKFEESKGLRKMYQRRVGWGRTEKWDKFFWHPGAGLCPSCLVHSNVRGRALVAFIALIVSASSAANMALKDLSRGQKLSTELIDMTVGCHHWALLAKQC
jgi:hypothetical protein